MATNNTLDLNGGKIVNVNQLNFVETTVQGITIGTASYPAVGNETSVVIGPGANLGTGTSQGMVLIGKDASGGVSRGSVCVGRDTASTGAYGVCLGYSCTASARGIAIGDSAISGYGAVAMGWMTYATNSRCVAIGHNVNCPGTKAVVVGGYSHARGDNCVTLGYDSGPRNVGGTGIRNIAIGTFALYAMNNSSANDNVAIGNQAGQNISIGNDNTVIGTFAGVTIAGGYDNTCVGANANVPSAAISRSTAIGKSATANSNSVAVGRLANASTFAGSVCLGAQTTDSAGTAAGFFVSLNGASIGTTASAATMRYDTTTKEILHSTSTRRHKDNIEDLEDLSWLFDVVRARRFVWKNLPHIKDAGKSDIGMIAERTGRRLTRSSSARREWGTVQCQLRYVDSSFVAGGSKFTQ